MDSPRLRLSILGIVALSLFAALFARLWYLQVVGTEEYQLAAEVQNTRQISVEAPRGRIIDLQGRVMVENQNSIVVTLDPTELADADERETMLLGLAEELTISGQPTKVEDLETALADPQYGPLEPVPVAKDVSEELEVFLLERAAEFPAVDVRREAVRNYPYGDLAAHILGYVGRINEDEYTEKMGTADEPVETEKPYEANDHIGKTGVERTYEDDLRGTPGIRTVEVDARGEIIRTVSYQPPEPGNDLQLSVDVDIQTLAEAALEEGLNQARARPPEGNNPRNQSPAGAVVVQNPRNGSLLAMASYPTYSPEEFIGGISSERYEELLGADAASDPFTNRAIAGQYAPGSTFKLITAYAALKNGLIGEYTPYYDDDGVYEAQGCEVDIEACEYNQPGGASGSVDVERAITVSSDTFFYWLGDRFWVESGAPNNGIQDAAEELGLHEPTGVPLPFEQSGWIPTQERKQERTEENPEAFPFGEWYSGDNIITAIGQGDVLVTPLQLSNAYSTFANRGTRYEPAVAWRILEPGGDPSDPESVVEVIQPEVTAELDMPDNVWNPMNRGFGGVPVSGTAAGAFAGWNHNSWPVSGKTGTAQVDGKADTAVFAAWGPTDDPQYTVVVFLEESGFGSDSAAPVARWILEPLSGQSELQPATTIEERSGAPVEECEEPEIDPLAPFATTTTTVQNSVDLYGDGCQS